MAKIIPAVSIIIPMYNSEKYIGECLESILAQTFDDYEVIVVDDCSTDNSCKVAESYIPRFYNGGGYDRLKIIRSKVNSGGCAGIPRNIGIRLSCGEYIFFMDSDDAIIPTAMEELYKFAKDFQVDVVHCTKYYRAPGETVSVNINRLTVMCDEKVEVATKPMRISDSVVDRVREFCEFKFLGFTWNRLIRRDFILGNSIMFPKIRAGHDHIFSFQVLCLANSILRVPKPYYIWRKNPNSISKADLPVDKLIHRWTDSLFKGTKLLDEFMDRFEDLRHNAEYKYLVISTIVCLHTNRLLEVYAQIPAYRLDELIRRELSELDDTTALTAFLFNRMYTLSVNMIQLQDYVRQQQETIQRLQTKLQQR